MIVVIDDDETQRVLAEHYLSELFGGQYRVSAHPPEEFESIDWSDTKVAIIDLMMHPTPGTEILAWLKEHYPNVKRVAWSAVVSKRGSDGPLAEEARILADVVISKLSPEDLADAIRKLRRDA